MGVRELRSELKWLDKSDPEYKRILKRIEKLEGSEEDLCYEITMKTDADTEFGWFTQRYEDEEKGVVSICRFPHRALLAYAINRGARHLAPPYECVSESGWKMYNDDPYHTDVWVGAGLSIENAYDHGSPDSMCLYVACEEATKAFLGLKQLDFITLAKPKDYIWERYRMFDLEPPPSKNSWSTRNPFSQYEDNKKEKYPTKIALIIPHGGVEFDMYARIADCIVTKAGGKMCHMATVMREKKKAMILMRNADEILRCGTEFYLDFDNHKVNISTR